MRGNSDGLLLVVIGPMCCVRFILWLVREIPVILDVSHLMWKCVALYGLAWHKEIVCN